MMNLQRDQLNLQLPLFVVFVFLELCGEFQIIV